MRTCDVCIVGAGVIGCTLARALARYELDVVVVEAAHDVAEGATKANSGVLYAGFHPRGGSLKGRSCVAGNAAYTRIAEELDVPLQRIGGLYLAFGDTGLERIAEKRERARANGLGELEVISGDEARELEPRLSPDVVAALVAPTTAIISPFELCLATARNAAANGVAFEFGFRVVDFERKGGSWVVHADDGRRIEAGFVANMAGEEAALLDAHVHAADLVVKPKRGQFIVFDKQDSIREETGLEPISHVLYQAQESDEGGTLLTPTVEGNLLAGPTSEDVRSFKDNATSREGLDHILRVARKIIPDLDARWAITEFSGIRVNIANVDKSLKDFVVRASAPGFVSMLGIKNPGMTAAPALVDEAVRLLALEGLPLREDASFDARDQGPSHTRPFFKCTPEQQARLLASDPRYGHILCRCELVTEGDVHACAGSVLPPATLDGLKHRLRCGMGRCQGAHCTPRIVQAMAEALHVDPRAVPKGEHAGSPVRGKARTW